jgi:hypothetical protein
LVNRRKLRDPRSVGRSTHREGTQSFAEIRELDSIA